MPYEVIAEGALTVLQDIGTRFDREGNEVPRYQANNYASGDVIGDDQVANIIVEQYDAGDEHTLSILKRLPEKKSTAKKKKAK